VQAAGAATAGREPIALVALNLGGPDSPEAVEPFLYNLFSDPEIIIGSNGHGNPT